VGVYVHWPYCARICPYCDFNVVRHRGGPVAAALAEAIVADLNGQADLIGPRRLASIFFGGGTPSLMDPEIVRRIVAESRRLWPSRGEIEITLEANPTDAEAERFAAFAGGGVNRLSLGLQSLDDASLKTLGRNHDAAGGMRAVTRALAAFQSVSLDLIYALPGQTPAVWSRELGRAAELGAEHISPYQLTIEPGTAFERAARRGSLRPPCEDLAAALYETTQTVLAARGFQAYEVSNHARSPSARSRHNLIYWRGEDYIGVGPGAHGRFFHGAGRTATETPKAVGQYIARVQALGHAASLTQLTPREVALERLLMGLRTSEGVAISDLAALGIGPSRRKQLGGMIRMRRGRLVATERARPVLDRVVAELAHG
jgi:oxygen-independent coproporphyrinogen-3 oxidase